MTNEATFRDHVEALSPHLRRTYALRVEEVPGDRDGDVLLLNELVRIRFFPGWPRDPYVEASVSYADESRLGSKRSIELWRYVGYTDGWAYFPTRWPKGKGDLRAERDKRYSHIGSPFQVLEIVQFLTALGDPLLSVDVDAIDRFLAWQTDEDRRYNEGVSQR